MLHWSPCRVLPALPAASLNVAAEEGLSIAWPNPWQPWCTAMQTIDAQPWLGKRVRLSAWLKTDNVLLASVWMRVNSDRMLQFDNMAGRFVAGTTSWTRYDVVLDVPAQAKTISFGTLLHAGGQMWADDFELHAVGGHVPSTNTETPEDSASRPPRDQTPDHPQANNRRPLALPQAGPRNMGIEE